MVPEFSWLPPEINSARMFAGAGSLPMLVAAAGWDGLAQELQISASSLHSVITGLASTAWSGATSLAMVAAATPYLGWLNTAAGQAELSAGQARAAATAFETALAATVPPPLVAVNRTSLLSLVATNFLGQNTPAIAATEFNYVQMWAQDVGAMIAYYTGATSVASTLTPFGAVPFNLTGLAQQVVPALQSAATALPVESLMSAAQMGSTPAGMLMSSLMQVAGMSSPAGMAAADLAPDIPALAGVPAAAVKPLSGGGLGSGMSAGLGQGRAIGPMSVPPTWSGSVPKEMASPALTGLGRVSLASTELASAPAAAGGGMPMMPMPTGGMGGNSAMPGAMSGRGGAGSQVVQSRPSVIPRIGVG